METSFTSCAHGTLLPAISSQQCSPSIASPCSVSKSFSSKTIVGIVLRSSKASSLFGESLRFAPKSSFKLSKAKNSSLVTKCEIGDSLEEFLTKATPDKGLVRLMMCMGEALRTIAFKVRTASCGGTTCVNSFGDEKLAVDMLANKLIFEALQHSHFCKYACSEELPELQDMGGPVEGGFSVTFDPLDGSSIVDTNFTVGTIFGVWPGDKFTGVTGADQVAAAMGIFGPRTTYVLALKDCPGTHEFLLLDEGKWQYVKNTTSIGEGKMFSPGNLRDTTDNPHYAKLVDYYIREKYTLRYTGGMVPDVNQANLRLLFEVAPLEFLIEKAGGYSSNGKQSVLDKVINNLDERSQVAYGSKNEIIRIEKTSSGEVSWSKSSGPYFTIGLVIAWYSSNIGVLLLNKYLLSNYGFRYPIFLTMCHMTACSLLSYIAITWMKMVPMQSLRSRVQFMKISALSLIFCASVVGGNVSLKYLPISFNQAIGATSPFFTAVFAYIMTLKQETWLTYVTLIPVVTGVVIASGGEPSFHMFGFMICIGGTAARALKSVVQGILLSSEGEKLNSMNLLLYTAPIAVVLLLPATLFMEENVFAITLALAKEDSRIIWLLVFNSTLAYFVNLTNFLVTKHTSALTLQVLGNAKGALAVVVSILIFKNPISVTGMLGYTLTVFGVILYSEAKKRGK